MGESDAEEFRQIAQFIPSYPSLADPEFSYNVARKKEFQDFAFGASDTLLPGLFRQQVILQRFLSPATLYNELLIFHQVGAGKTASALAVAESWKTRDRESGGCAKDPKTQRLKTPGQCPLIIVRNVDRFTPIFERELRARFPAYRPPEATFKKNYEIVSHRTAGKKTSFSDRVIIIDEAHNLQPQTSDGGGGSDYHNLLQRLRVATNSKKILLTGTPIPDQARQIIPLMNLILPDPIPVDAYRGKNFERLYFPGNKFDPKSTKAGPEYDLVRQFRGRVSYFRTLIPTISQQNEGEDVKIRLAGGEIITIGKTVPVVCNVMSDFQYTRATESFVKAKTSKEAFGQTARRDATMVFPDRALSNKRIENLIAAMPRDLATLQKYSATFHAIVSDILAHPNDLFFVYLDYVNGPGGQVNFGKVLEHFLGYSDLRARRTQKGRKGGKKYAVLGFQKFVSAGSSLLKKIKRGGGDFNLEKTQSRIETPLEAENRAQQILNIFNSPANLREKRIQVLIGGQKSGEGITIKNVTRVHLIPYWNFAKPQQAIGRTIRPTSHNALIESVIRQKLDAALGGAMEFEFDPLIGLTRQFTLKGDRKDADEVGRVPDFRVKEVREGRVVAEWTGVIKVRVFHHVAVGPPGPSDPPRYRATQDVRVFHSATQKYAKTDQVLEFLKQISFDCPLTYPVNMRVSGTGDNYRCDGFPEEAIEMKSSVWKYPIPPDQLQYDTYDCFYTHRDEIVATLVPLFNAHPILSFRQIIAKTKKRPNPLLGALQEIISRNVLIKNRFGFPCCLREDRDMFFLVAFRDAFRDDQTYEQAIYGALPFVTFRTSLQTLNDYQMLAPQDATDNLRDFCKNPWDSEAFSQLSFQSRIRFLEEVYRYQREGGEAKVPPFLADLLKEIYEIPGMEGGTPVPVHIMFAKFHSDVGSDYRTKLGKTGELRVLGEEGWRDAFPAEEEYFLPLVEDEEKVGL